jgi:hypothetical protein
LGGSLQWPGDRQALHLALIETRSLRQGRVAKFRLAPFPPFGIPKLQE